MIGRIKEKKQLVIVLTALGMTVGFLLFFYLPLSHKMRAVRQNRAEQKKLFDQASEKYIWLSTLQQQLTELEKKTATCSASVPGNRKLGGFIQQVSSLMNQHDLENQIVRPEKDNGSESLKCIPINIECTGSLSQLFEFFHSLGQLERLLCFERASFINDPDLNGKVTVKTRALIYYRPDEQGGGKI